MSLKNKPVVAVGGGGGSGTRVVAEIIQKSGYYIGADLNKSLDNLWFTLLFRRPWHFPMNSDFDELNGLLDIFFAAMQGQFNLGLGHLNQVVGAAWDFWFHESRRKKSIFWIKNRIKSLIKSSKNNSFGEGVIGWGWKEPNTHIFLPYLVQRNDIFCYIHVIRHGLDMAFSWNQNQLYDWHNHFDIKLPESETEMPKVSLKYWVSSNKRAIEIGQRQLGDNFYILNFDDLCLKPKEEIEKLLAWLHLPMVELEDVASLVKAPNSIGRYKRHDLKIFSRNDIEFVEDMGFQIDGK